MLRSLATLVLLSTCVFGGQVSYTVTSAPAQMQPGGYPGLYAGTTLTQIPRFDRSLGRLEQVDLIGHAQINGTVFVENLDNNDYFCDGGFTYTFAGNVFGEDHAFGLPAFDGTLDYGGTSGLTWPFAATNFCLGNYDSGSYQCYPIVMSGLHAQPAAADAWSGLGFIDHVMVITMSGQMLGAPCASGGPSNLDVLYDAYATATYTVTYTYEDFPARFCYFEIDPLFAYGQPSCPCTPSASGCPNSQNPQGANLIPVGNSSISADTFGLAAFGMGATAPCLFFQGSSATYSGSFFGDGRRCVSGIVRRLGIKQASGGAASYPGAQDVPIHLRGQIGIPGTFAAYQVWYRDASPSFCTPSTFNLTSAVATVWTP